MSLHLLHQVWIPALLFKHWAPVSPCSLPHTEALVPLKLPMALFEVLSLYYSSVKVLLYISTIIRKCKSVGID